jgi:hypothetical protein
MNKNIRIEEGKVLLCCGKTRCPSIAKDENSSGSFIITDDYEGSVKLTRDQLEAVSEALNYLEELPESNQVNIKEED